MAERRARWSRTKLSRKPWQGIHSLISAIQIHTDVKHKLLRFVRRRNLGYRSLEGTSIGEPRPTLSEIGNTRFGNSPRRSIGRYRDGRLSKRETRGTHKRRAWGDDEIRGTRLLVQKWRHYVPIDVTTNSAAYRVGVQINELNQWRSAWKRGITFKTTTDPITSISL